MAEIDLFKVHVKPPLGKRPEACALTPKQQKQWDNTRVALLYNCPAFAHIFYTLLDTVKSDHIAMFTKDIPIAATDGACIMLNPDTFFELSLDERVFALAHEILHCVFNHCAQGYGFHKRGEIAMPDGTKLPYVHTLANVAQDLVINDALIEASIGKFKADWLHDTKIGRGTDSWIDVYRRLFKRVKIKDITVSPGAQFDEHLQPGTSSGKDPHTASSERNEQEWQTQVAAAMASAKAQGKLPASLDRMFSEFLEPKVDWTDKIEGIFARKIGGGTYNWRKADRRLIVRDIYAPGRTGFGAGTVVVAVDTSGSIGQKELDTFFGEMSGILEDVRPQRIINIWCDAAVNRVDEIEDAADLNGVRMKGAVGGGGTDFRPVFDWVDKQNITVDALIYLTDLQGSFPKEAPEYPTIWGNILKGSTAPWGDVIDIPVG